MIVCPYCATANDNNATVCKTCGASLDGAQYPTALRPGTLLQGGKYRLEKVLGQGGFGITYKAQNIPLGIPVVVKEYHPSGSSRVGTSVRPPGTLTQQEFQDARARFADEARVVAQLTLKNPNPHIVRVYDVFTENDSEYYAMEFLEGKSLQSTVEKGGPLSEAAVLEIAQQITSALDLVHAAGLLHRDIKPDNIMMVARGAVLIDFGSARSIANSGAKQSIIVTPGYAPLEQYASNARRGPFTDIYALAGTLLFALTGKEPVPATDRASGASQPSARDLNPKVSKAFSDVLERAMRMRVDERPQSVEEFAGLLEGAIKGGGKSPGKNATPKAQPTARSTPPPPPYVSPPPVQTPPPPPITNPNQNLPRQAPGAQIFQPTTPGKAQPAAKPASSAGGDWLWMLYLLFGGLIVAGQFGFAPRTVAVIGFYGAVLLTAYLGLQWLIGTWIGRIVLFLGLLLGAALYFNVIDVNAIFGGVR
jgi:serine/threonine-protein kinase